MIILLVFLSAVALIALCGAIAMYSGARRERRRRQRREQPATLEGGGSHLSADRRR